jgi:uncharacterized protein (DUF1778 family)
MPTAMKNAARLDLRVNKHTKHLISRAAALSGQTVSEFVKGVAVSKAQSVLREHEMTVLSERDWRIFVSVLDSNTKPNAALARAAQEYNAHRGRS